LSALGLIDHPISWISGSPNLALGSSIGLVIWRFAGFNMLILLTGLGVRDERDQAGSHRPRRAACSGLASPGRSCRALGVMKCEYWFL
ncbi:MAG TPA: hypothetical protein VK193_10105, partial [Methyloceanibacter sp.]|nr:hypothetical protein [Methyloceanibacter sp.]